MLEKLTYNVTFPSTGRNFAGDTRFQDRLRDHHWSERSR